MVDLDLERRDGRLGVERSPETSLPEQHALTGLERDGMTRAHGNREVTSRRDNRLLDERGVCDTVPAPEDRLPAELFRNRIPDIAVGLKIGVVERPDELLLVLAVFVAQAELVPELVSERPAGRPEVGRQASFVGDEYQSRVARGGLHMPRVEIPPRGHDHGPDGQRPTGGDRAEAHYVVHVVEPRRRP